MKVNETKEIKIKGRSLLYLFEWISELCQSLPGKSIPTFIELLFGAMLTSSGFVTQSYLAIDMKRHWTTYYKWIEYGHWSWVALARQLFKLIVKWFYQGSLYLIIDDSFTFRASKGAPGSKIHHQHGKKANRPVYALGQCWVSLSLVLTKGARNFGIPLLPRLMKKTGNSGKLVAAKVLIRVFSQLLPSVVTLLLDCWFMKAKVITYALEKNIKVIGQVRIDTALYELPLPEPKRRGPNRKKGAKITKEMVDSLAGEELTLFIYGKTRKVKIQSIIAKARFLKWLPVMAIWITFMENKSLKKNLILSTNLDLSPKEILFTYAKRWSIEPMFNQLKNSWGARELWQQTSQVFSRWGQIISVGYALLQLLAYLGEKEFEDIVSPLEPWRAKHPITAGRVRRLLVRVFMHVRVRQWWDPKSKKLILPESIALSQKIVFRE